jgi:hypothetical protein
MYLMYIPCTYVYMYVCMYVCIYVYASSSIDQEVKEAEISKLDFATWTWTAGGSLHPDTIEHRKVVLGSWLNAVLCLCRESPPPACCPRKCLLLAACSCLLLLPAACCLLPAACYCPRECLLPAELLAPAAAVAALACLQSCLPSVGQQRKLTVPDNCNCSLIVFVATLLLYCLAALLSCCVLF